MLFNDVLSGVYSHFFGGGGGDAHLNGHFTSCPTF